MYKPAKLPKKYFEAIGWIAANDDTTWLDDTDVVAPSVTLVLVADLFKVPVEEATKHLRHIVNALKQLGPDKP